ncbi:uncharacterized protein LOC129148942 [Eptesicus fuscus]|uniref:uncharacterized protein LOC129148942 n=1 Tax=Eptesicus fuscus TaxID=29078 RepID=UPI002404602F|nr:uncharacterized protein LOC129148942 [Eptesicus fuscus]
MLRRRRRSRRGRSLVLAPPPPPARPAPEAPSRSAPRASRASCSSGGWFGVSSGHPAAQGGTRRSSDPSVLFRLLPGSAPCTAASASSLLGVSPDVEGPPPIPHWQSGTADQRSNSDTDREEGPVLEPGKSKVVVPVDLVSGEGFLVNRSQKSVMLSWEEGSALFSPLSHTFHLESRHLCSAWTHRFSFNSTFNFQSPGSTLSFLSSMSSSLPQIKSQKASEIKLGVN